MKNRFNTRDFLRWYLKTSHASRSMATNHLYEMEEADVKALTRLANDLIDDLARHRKRKICIGQLNEGEHLVNW